MYSASSSIYQFSTVKKELADNDDIACDICDDGGEVLLCEGSCLRAFHPTVQSGVHSQCESLCFKNASEYEALDRFLCPNCKHKMHQCFICGKLGSSDLLSGPQVYPCSDNNCGRYYHPLCVSEKLCPSDFRAACKLAYDIGSGTIFTCPVHWCATCVGSENPSVPALQFAVCRRCPVSYHRMCLPSDIYTAHDDQPNVDQRAWEGLLSGRILIYCMDHSVDSDLQTPTRNHLSFPCVEPNIVSEDCSTHPMSASKVPDNNAPDKHIKYEPNDTH